MSTEQMLPIIDKMDKVGYHAVECWGGATFDSCLRFLKEDPWERLRKLRDGFKNTKLQMLFRGQNILGYNHYADDVVEYFVQKSISNGIDIIRIFDCLNDIRNLETAVKATNKEKGHAQIALCYTLGDAYTLDYWKDIARRIEDMGADSLCIKDMAGLLTPRGSRAGTGAEGRNKPSYRPAYPLHIRCCFHDLLKGSRGRMRNHRLRHVTSGSGNKPAGH
jgi:oxaloacetate decarboxylase alpha subunit